MLGAVDVLVLLKVAAKRGARWTQPELADELGMGQSTVSRSLNASGKLGLYRSSTKRVNGRGLEDALVHGARYFLAPERGGDVRGMPTAWAAPPLVDAISTDEPLPPVWPDPLGETRGLGVEPLHPKVPEAARTDPALYELLALVDVLRIGGARERGLAAKALRERLSPE